MRIDTNRVDEAVLALMCLGLHQNYRTWKGFDREALKRLYEKGMISNPIGRETWVMFTEKGRQESERLCQQLFGARD